MNLSSNNKLILIILFSLFASVLTIQTNITIAIDPLLDPELLRDDLQIRFGSGARVIYETAVAKYPTLSKFVVTQGSRVRTRLGTVVVLYFRWYQLENRFAGLINCRGKVEQILNYEPVNDNDDPTPIALELCSKYRLSINRLLQITSNGSTYIYDYLIQGSQVGRFTINRNENLGQDPKFNYQQIELGNILLPQITKNLQTRTPLDRQQPNNFIYYQNANFIVLDYGETSISAQLDYCQFLVNEPVAGRNSYNFDPDFFKFYKKVKQISPIFNLPEIKDVQISRSSDGTRVYGVIFMAQQTHFKIDFAFSPPNTIRIISITVDGLQIFPQTIDTIDTISEPEPPTLKQPVMIITNFIVGCQVYNSQENCLECDENFLLKNGRCIPQNQLQIIIQNCVSMNIKRECTQCANNYYLQSDGLCYLIPDFCSVPINFGRGCFRCRQGYTLTQRGTCETENCLIYNAQAKICVRCKNRYYLVAGLNICERVSPLCVQHDALSPKCYGCINGYVLNRDYKCIPFSPITNCQIYNQYGQCVECRFGFEYNPSTKLCNPYIAIDFCLEYDFNSRRCLQCKPSYSLSLSSTKCVPTISYCHTYSDTGRCLSCIQSYNLTGNGLCVPQITYCIYYSDDGSCLNCSIGFQLTNFGRKCQPDIPNCQISQFYYCIKCDYGYVLNEAGRCVADIPFCVQFNVEGLCLRCLDPYFVRNNTCNIQNCIRYRSNRICIGCLQGTTLISQYGINVCRTQILHCVKYRNNQAQPLCEKCEDNYYLYVDFNACFPVPEHCLTYNKLNSHCTQCINNFTIIDGQCIPSTNSSIDNCINIQYNQCKQCKQPYTLINNNCILVVQIQHCRSIVEGQCVFCQPDYYLEMGACKLFVKVPYCAIYASSGVCLQCVGGYTVYQSHCYRCENPHFVVPNCNQCQFGYTKYNGACHKTIQGCQLYNFDSYCAKCRTGLNLINNECVDRIPFCFVEQLGRCLACFEGYFISERDGSCIGF